VTATIIDGKVIARDMREHLKSRVQALGEHGVTPPHLRIIVSSDDADQTLYAGRLRKTGEALGIEVEVENISETLTDERLAGEIQEVNRDPRVDGVIVTMPLPRELSADTVYSLLDPAKDVDGVTVANAGRLYLGQAAHPPSTASAIMDLIHSVAANVRGMNAVVVGRSAIVGKPTWLLLMREGATVTECHTGTTDLGHHTRQADILVSAAGRPKLITADMIKPGAIVIDAGINETDGGITGDVDFPGVSDTASAITPVPGGVGPVTNVVLLREVVLNAESRARAV
jgi:methylenetetrahydrofolate dehydrogenase (NADP+)/methenyltetrahydrofolate cyclohydrolase